eukprot:scaffold398229_cov47-Prasinocladus_malaysianus.AAC.1
MQTAADVASPLHALRSAQVLAMGGSPQLGVQACNSILGATLGTKDEEEFAQAMLLWICDREEELAQ